MAVNDKKSKVMIFRKKSTRKLKQNLFTLNNNKLETVQEFTYLGVKLSATGNFSAHQTQSREKALYAFYNVTRSVDFKKLKPKQANLIFDTLISPILTYGSEVLGVYLKQDFNKWEKSPTEKVHLRFCKYYLGVNSKTMNIACRADLARFPMKLVIDRLILKYFNHLLCLPGNTVASQAFLISKSVYERNKACYLTNLHKILDMFKISDSSRLDKPFSISTLESYDTKMKSEYSLYGNKT